jgi:hypothetical protein
MHTSNKHENIPSRQHWNNLFIYITYERYVQVIDVIPMHISLMLSTMVLKSFEKNCKVCMWQV